MKTPKATKLKSGSWRVQIQIDGKRHSCIGRTKKEAQDVAKLLFAGIEQEKKIPLTVGKAMDDYILSVDGTLSPSTIVGYKNIRKNHLQSIMKIQLSDLTVMDVQRAINKESANGKSPKTIRNSVALLSKVLKVNKVKFDCEYVLPQKEKPDIKIPTEAEFAKILRVAEGTRYKLPIMLGGWLGLRASEIRGLKFSDVNPMHGTIHIRRAVVEGPNGPVEKLTKTESSDRVILLPDVIDDLIKSVRIGRSAEDYICPIRQNVLLKAFHRICRIAGVPEYRFHDLRHFAASVAHSLNIPDKYVMELLGHSTDNMLKTVYQHIMREKENEFAFRMNENMEMILKNAHENAHEIPTMA